MRVTVLGPAEELLSPEELPFFRGGIRAEFPTPADDYLDGCLALQDILIEHPAATFLIKVEGHSMKDASILDGDIAVVDRALHPSNGRTVVAVVDENSASRGPFIGRTTAFWNLPTRHFLPSRSLIAPKTKFGAW